MVACDDLLGCSFEKEVHIEISTCCHVTQSCRAVIIKSRHCCHCIGVSEEYSEELAWRSSLDKNKRVHTVDLLSTSSIIIRRLLPVGEHGPRALSQWKLPIALPKTIQLLSWQLQINLHELVRKPEALVSRVDQYLIERRVLVVELERIIVDPEPSHIDPKVIVILLLRHDVRRNAPPVLIVIVANIQVCSCEVSLRKPEEKSFDDLVVLARGDGERIDLEGFV